MVVSVPSAARGVSMVFPLFQQWSVLERCPAAGATSERGRNLRDALRRQRWSCIGNPAGSARRE